MVKIAATGTYSNNFYIGDGLSSSKYIYFNQSSINNPGIRYSSSDGYFQKSDDGINWQKILGQNDITPTTIYYTTVTANNYETSNVSFSNPLNTITQYDVYTVIRRPTDGYGYISNCNFSITGLNNQYRFVGYNSSQTSLTTETSILSSTDNSSFGVEFTLDAYSGNLFFKYKASVAGAVCISSIIYYGKGTAFSNYGRSADWWNGNTCKEWEFTQARMYEGIGASGGLGQVCSYTGPVCVNTAYLGGVYCPNGRIYMFPNAQSNQSTWHYIDTYTNTVVGYTNGATVVANGYGGGVLSPNGRIYLVPVNQASQSTWHYIDTKTNIVVGYTGGVGAVTGAYRGGVLAPNGRIYLCPASQGSQTNWHYIDSNTATVTAYANGAALPTAFSYNGGVLAPNGNIYLVPSDQGIQSTWHYINTNTGAVQSYTPGIAMLACQGGVLSPDGKIYLVAQTQAQQSTWYYIDSNTNTVTGYSNPYTIANGSAYRLGAYSPNGRIYFSPADQGSQSTWHYIDVTTKSVVAYTHGVTTIADAYRGAVATPNGRIYLIPSAQATQSTWHYIETTSNYLFNKNMCMNPMFNKY